MPSRDKTGPFGEGELTGRGFGNCVGSIDKKNPRKERPFLIRRFRAGGGLRRGFGFNRFNQPCFYEAYPETSGFEFLDNEKKKKVLEKELLELESEKKEIEKKLKELEYLN